MHEKKRERKKKQDKNDGEKGMNGLKRDFADYTRLLILVLNHSKPS